MNRKRRGESDDGMRRNLLFFFLSVPPSERGAEAAKKRAHFINLIDSSASDFVEAPGAAHTPASVCKASSKSTTQSCQVVKSTGESLDLFTQQKFWMLPCISHDNSLARCHILLYIMSQWTFGRPAFTAREAADAARRENTKPLQRPSET